MARPTPLRIKLGEAEAEIAELQHANEQIASEYTLLSRRVEELAFIDLNNITNASDEVLPQAKRVETVNRIRRLRHENPMAKQAIKLALRFVLGKGVSYEIRDTNTKRIIDDFWNDPVNQAVWTSHFAQVLNFDENLTDGEQFVIFFTTPGESPYVRIGLMPMEEVTNILYDPDNGRMPVWYRRVYKKRHWDAAANNGEGGWKVETTSKPIVRYYRDFRVSDEYLADIESRGLVIPEKLQAEGRVKHRMINPVKMRSGLRGISELFASREWFRVIKEFMEDRGAVNAQANALTMQRRILGGPVAVAGMTGKFGGVSTGVSDQPLTPSAFRRPMPGSTMDTNQNVEYKNIRADTGAPSADRDAGRLIAIAGAGTATPEHYFGGTNSTLAGAQSVELAVIKAFEDFQTYLRNDHKETTEFVIGEALSKPISEVEAGDKEIAWKFPPIMTQDIVKWITGLAQWAQQIAPDNRVVREEALRAAAQVLGIHNLDMIWEEVMVEEKRIAAQKDAETKMRMEQQQKSLDAPIVAPGGGLNGAAKNGAKPAGQKTTTGPTEQGASPDLTRMKAGRPPREGATGPRSRREAEGDEVEDSDFADLVRHVVDESSARELRRAEDYSKALQVVAERPEPSITINVPEVRPPDVIVNPAQVTIEKGAVQVDVAPPNVTVKVPPSPVQKAVRRTIVRDKDKMPIAFIDKPLEDG